MKKTRQVTSSPWPDSHPESNEKSLTTSCTTRFAQKLLAPPLIVALLLVFASSGCNDTTPPISSPTTSAQTTAADPDSAPPQQPQSSHQESHRSDLESTTTPLEDDVIDVAEEGTEDASQDSEVIQVAAVNPQDGDSEDDAAVDAEDGDDEEREKLFAGWTKPDLGIFITGRQYGYIEPCGCTGLDNQKGGLMRRHSLLKSLTSQGWPMVAVDAGNQVRRFGRQPEIKFQRTVDALKTMKYQAIGFGPDDLKLTFNELFAVAGKLDGDSPFVCSNVALLDEEYSNQYVVVEQAGKRIGVTAFLGTEHQQQVKSDEIVLKSASDGLTAVWPKLEKENCDLYILLAHGSLDESREMARKFPDFHLVVTAGGAGEPTNLAERIEGTDTLMVQTGTKGMYVGVVGVYFGQEKPFRYQRVPLDSRFEDSAEMMRLFREYQNMLKTLGLAGLGLKPLAHPSGHQFVGSKTCQDCHEEEYDIWHDGIEGLDDHGPHTLATESLVHPSERGSIPRHFDPECLSCHVTGWNPQKFYPYASGYTSLEESKHVHMNGCENCHGPGSAHVDAESDGDDESLMARLRAEMNMSRQQAEAKCNECHDHDNSPDFHDKGAFARYWRRIAHGSNRDTFADSAE